jgi:hypothetical protein
MGLRDDQQRVSVIGLYNARPQRRPKKKYLNTCKLTTSKLIISSNCTSLTPRLSTSDVKTPCTRPNKQTPTPSHLNLPTQQMNSTAEAPSHIHALHATRKDTKQNNSRNGNNAPHPTQWCSIPRTCLLPPSFPSRRLTRSSLPLYLPSFTSNFSPS